MLDLSDQEGVLDSGYPWGVRNICNLNKVSLCRLVCGTRERERAS